MEKTQSFITRGEKRTTREKACYRVGEKTTTAGEEVYQLKGCHSTSTFIIFRLLWRVEGIGVHCFASTPSLCDAPGTSRTPVDIGHLKRQLEAGLQGPH